MTINKKMQTEHLIRRTSVRVIKFGYLCDVRLKTVYKPCKFESFELLTDVISRDPDSKNKTLTLVLKSRRVFPYMKRQVRKAVELTSVEVLQKWIWALIEVFALTIGRNDQNPHLRTGSHESTACHLNQCLKA
jgi:acetolactate synthase regulatory subunit